MAYDAEKESRIENLVIERNRLGEEYEACQFVIHSINSSDVEVHQIRRLNHTMNEIQLRMDEIDVDLENLNDEDGWLWIANAGWREPTDYEPHPQSVVSEESPPSTNLPLL